MDKIKVMISSKVEGLEAERDVIKKLFDNHPMIELIGAVPYASTSHATSSAVETVQMARECDLYILILGSEFGMELPNGKSATEVEFDAAFRQDPTKILVFLKEEEIKNEKQKAFIERVCNYYSGYWRATFKFSHVLEGLVNDSILSWLKDRATLGSKVSHCEHFIRQALQMKPTPETQVYYRVTKDDVEIEYKTMGSSHIIQYSRNMLIADFWKCVYELQAGIDRWLEDGNNIR